MTITELWESGKEMAVKMATAYTSKLPPMYQPEDFEQAALTELWVAAQSFKQGSGVKFTSFAYRHVYGALRRERWRYSCFGDKARAYDHGKGLWALSCSLPSYLQDNSSHDYVSSYEDCELVDLLLSRIASADVKTVIRRRCMEDVPVKDVSEEMRTSKDRVGRLLHEGMERLISLACYYTR